MRVRLELLARSCACDRVARVSTRRNCCGPCPSSYLFCHRRGHIDRFFLVSKTLLPAFSGVLSDWEVPWSPHAAQRAYLCQNFRALRSYQFFSPRKLPLERSDPSLSWSVAHQLAAAHPDVQAVGTGHCRELCEPRPDRSAAAHATSASLGVTLAQWARAAELWTLSAAGYSVLTGREKDIRPYLGRATLPCRRLAPVLHQDGPLSGAFGVSALVRILETVDAMWRRAQSSPSRFWADSLLDMYFNNHAVADQLRHSLKATEYATLALAWWQACFDRLGLGTFPHHRLQGKLQALRRRYDKSSKEAWRTEWVERMRLSLDGHGREAHAFVSSAVKKAPGPPRMEGVTSNDPVELVDAVSLQWFNRWHSTLPTAAAAEQAVNEYIAHVALDHRAHIDDVLAAVTPHSVHATLKTFSRHTAIGIDGMCFQWMASLPAPALADLADLIRQVVLALEWPRQTQLHLMVALAKKLGGFRLIAIASSFVRLTMRLVSHRFTKPWDRSVAHEGDTAAPGRNCQQAAVRRALRMEVATVLDEAAVLILWDAEAYYDLFDLPLLVPELRYTSFPPVPAALGLRTHRACRSLSVENAVAAPGFPGLSIIAGDASSTSLARGQTLRTVQATATRHPGTSLAQHVDDMSQLTIADSPVGALRGSIDAGLHLIYGLRLLKVKLSSKSVVLSNTKGLAAKVAKALHTAGIVARAVKWAEDVGVGTTAGAHRDTTALKARLRKAASKAWLARRLAAHRLRTARLVTGNILPTGEYGVQASGVAPARRTQLRKAAAMALTGHSFTRCFTSLLHLHLGADADPAVHLPVHHLRDWCATFLGAPAKEQRRIIQAWRTERDRLIPLDRRRRWANVRGPMSAAIAYLLEVGWQALSPHVFVTPDGRYSVNILAGPSSVAAFTVRYKATLIRRLWIRASREVGGDGLESGPPSFLARTRARKVATKVGAHHLLADIDRCATGGAALHTSADSPRPCRFCGDPETLAHRYRYCPGIQQIPDPHGFIRKGAWVFRLFTSDEFRDTSCLWARGLVPASLLSRDADLYEPDPRSAKAVGPFFGTRPVGLSHLH